MCFNLGYKLKKKKGSKRSNNEGNGLLLEELERYKEKQQNMQVNNHIDDRADSSPLLSIDPSKSDR